MDPKLLPKALKNPKDPKWQKELVENSKPSAGTVAVLPFRAVHCLFLTPDAG